MKGSCFQIFPKMRDKTARANVVKEKIKQGRRKDEYKKNRSFIGGDRFGGRSGARFNNRDSVPVEFFLVLYGRRTSRTHFGIGGKALYDRKNLPL